MLVGRVSKPANGSRCSPLRPEPIFKWASQVQSEPTYHVSDCSVLVVRQHRLIEHLEGSTAQARRHMRVLINLTADKTYEHKNHHRRLVSSNHNRSTLFFCAEREEIGCGRRNRTF